MRGQSKKSPVPIPDGKRDRDRIVETIALGLRPELQPPTPPAVSMETFLRDPYFAGGIENLRDIIRQGLIDLFDRGQYVEVSITGGIGVGKSVFIELALVYLIYQLGCLQNPQKTYGLLPGSAIFIVNQSVNETLARKVIFNELRQRIDAIPYFKDHFPYVPHIETELRFPNNITVLPLSSSNTAALGLSIFSGVIDEINFLPVIEHSRHSHDRGTFNAAEEMYNTIARRLRSRFITAGGTVPGKVIGIASAKYPDSFTERKRKEARTDPSIFFRSYSLWEARPELNTGPHFFVEVGGGRGPHPHPHRQRSAGGNHRAARTRPDAVLPRLPERPQRRRARPRRLVLPRHRPLDSRPHCPHRL